MSDNTNTIRYTTPENFDKSLSELLPNPYEEFQKVSIYFSKVIQSSGPDSFSTTLLVFNKVKKMVGLVACRPVADKDDLYKALSQMLHFPVSLGSELFIIVQDSRVTTADDPNNKKDALVTTFVTPNHCGIFTLPYTVDSSNNVSYDFSSAWLTQIDEDYNKDKAAAVGDMVEMFYLFSHTNTTGPFSPHEVLTFFKTHGFAYEIINPENMKSDFIALPIAF